MVKIGRAERANSRFLGLLGTDPAIFPAGFTVRPVAGPASVPFPVVKTTTAIVAIPAFNEETHIGEVVKGCLAQGVETWVVDDGSQDATAARAREAGARVIVHPQNRGKGMAIRTAFAEFLKSSKKYLVILDADGQHDPSRLPAFIEAAEKGEADVLVGNRMDHAEAMPLVRRLTNRFMSWMVSRFAGQRIPDSQCGFRLLTRAFAERFQPTTGNFDLESEMLIQAGRMGFRIGAVPIPTIYGDEKSKIRPVRDTLRFLKFLWRQLGRWGGS